MGRWGLYSSETDCVLDCYGTLMNKLKNELQHKKKLCDYTPFPQHYDKFFEILRKYINDEYYFSWVLKDSFILSGILLVFTKWQLGIKGSGMCEKFNDEESPYSLNKLPALHSAIPKDIKELAAKWLDNYYVENFNNDSDSVSVDSEDDEYIEKLEQKLKNAKCVNVINYDFDFLHAIQDEYCRLLD